MFHDVSPPADRFQEYDAARSDALQHGSESLEINTLHGSEVQDAMTQEAGGEPVLEVRRHEDRVAAAAGRTVTAESFEVGRGYDDNADKLADSENTSGSRPEDRARDAGRESDEPDPISGDSGSHSGGNDGGSHDDIAEAGDDDEGDRANRDDAGSIVNMDLLSGGDSFDISKVADEIVAAIKAGQDVVSDLDRASQEAPEEAAELAYRIRDGILADEAIVQRTSTDTLVWVRAGLTLGEADSVDIAGAACLDGVLQERLGSEHARDKLTAATFWADSDDKTVGRVHELTRAMDTLEAGLTEPGESRTRELLAANFREGVQPPLEGYEFQPLTATYTGYDNPFDPEGPKHTIVGNNGYAAEHGGDRYGFHGSAPMGVMVAYQGKPLMLTTFDVRGPDVTIHQMQGANKYGVERPDGSYEEVVATPNRIANFDMAGLAISTVARVVDDLGLVPDPSQANLHIVSARNCPDVDPLDPKAITLERAEKVYDAPAQDRQMDVDADGNWVTPLRKLL